MSAEFKYYQYADDIINNRINACKLVKLAVQRFYNDLEKCNKGIWEYTFSDNYAQQAILFFRELVHTKGPLAGTKLETENWQEFIIANLYGFRLRSNPRIRRFKKCYCSTGRKQGKTFLASGVLLYGLLSEKNGGECYSVGVKKDQARLCFLDCKKTVQYSKTLSKFVKVNAHNLSYADGTLTALASDSNSLDGLNCSTVVVDEFSQHKNADLLSVMESSQGARQSPLTFIITTCSSHRDYPCFAEFERCEKMLQGQSAYLNEEYFAIIYTLDKDDDWRNSDNWIKANPNLGKSTTIEGMLKDLKNAEQSNTYLNEFLNKRMNIWTSALNTWINDTVWQKCLKKFNEKNLVGKECFCAIDLSRRNDLTCYSLYFPLPNGKIYAKHRAYLPSGTIENHFKTDSYLYKNWVKQGYIKVLQGETIDYDFIYNDILADAKQYNIIEIAYDRALSATLIEPLANSFNMVDFPQTIMYISEPAKNWEKAIIDGNIIDNNPLMRHCVSCCEIYSDSSGNIKPVKPNAKSGKRIDLVYTSLMANNRLEIYQSKERQENALSVADMLN